MPLTQLEGFRMTAHCFKKGEKKHALEALQDVLQKGFLVMSLVRRGMLTVIADSNFRHEN